MRFLFVKKCKLCSLAFLTTFFKLFLKYSLILFWYHKFIIHIHLWIYYIDIYNLIYIVSLAHVKIYVFLFQMCIYTHFRNKCIYNSKQYIIYIKSFISKNIFISKDQQGRYSTILMLFPLKNYLKSPENNPFSSPKNPFHYLIL